MPTSATAIVTADRTTPRLRVGLIGCGFMGRTHAQAYRSYPQTDLVAVCDADTARAADLGREMGAQSYTAFTDMLANEQLDLVSVVTPDTLHAEPTIASLDAGAHVLVEKPIAVDLSEARQMVAAADRFGRKLAVNFNRRFSRPFALAREYQATGRLGDPAYVLLRVSLAPGRPSTNPYELSFDSLIHLVDLARCFGGDVASVTAHMADVRREGKYHNVAIGLRFAHGGVGTIVGSWDGSRLHPIEYAEIGGTAGRVEVDNVVGSFAYRPADSDIVNSWTPQPFGGRHHLLQFYPTTVEQHLAELVPALIEGRDPPVTGADGLAALRILVAAIRSFESGTAVAPASV
ncbi:MAG: Gfo/Idh/MocA family oxidoreductase [Chloroflexota bacterium]